MARNEEKHLTQLNRLHLQKLREEELEKNPPRPQLRYLDTAAEIQKWLPSIKRDMQIALAQSQVPCYTDDKVDEYRREVDKLQREYIHFVRKLKNLNPNVTVTPWTSRGYIKRKYDEPGESEEDSDQSSFASLPKRINLPIMDLPVNKALPPPPEFPRLEFQDQALKFTSFGPPKMNYETFAEHHSQIRASEPILDLVSVESNSNVSLTSAEASSECDSSPTIVSNLGPASRRDLSEKPLVFGNSIPTPEEKRTVFEMPGSRSQQPLVTLPIVADYSSEEEAS